MSRLRPLRKKTKEGELYKRTARTEALIQTCLELSFEEFANRAKIIARKQDGYIPSEVLVYFLRQTKTHDNDIQFGVLYQMLEKRIKRVCPRSDISLGEKGGAIAHLLDFQEFVLDDFIKRVVRDRQEYNEKLDGFEVAFDRMIARRKLDAWRKMYKRDKPTTELKYDEDGDIAAEVEASLARLNPNERSVEDDITYRFQLQRAIETLPEDEKRVINMIFAGIPSESADPDVPTISKILGCGPQTVRNRRNRAVIKLKEILGTEVNDVN
jgi:RNA polymerase sigma factor (sigma-70 family)